MPENGDIQLHQPGPLAMKAKVPKIKPIGIKAAQSWMKRAGTTKIRALKLRAYSKAGQFIEQEGEHHIARTILAESHEHLKETLGMCEDMLAKAIQDNNADAKEKAIRLKLLTLAELNTSAKNLNLTRRKNEERTDDSAFKVPTMPARIAIQNNNTQVVAAAVTKQ